LAEIIPSISFSKMVLGSVNLLIKVNVSIKK
jgi:hypothetical protein